MTFRCGLCMVSPSADGFEGSREDVEQHLRDHSLPEDSFDTYLMEVDAE